MTTMPKVASRQGVVVTITKEKAPQPVASLYRIWTPYYTGMPVEGARGPVGRHAAFFFDHKQMFEPTTGRLVRVRCGRVTAEFWASSRAVLQKPTVSRIAALRTAIPGKGSSLGSEWGPLGTVLGGALLVVQGGPVGMVIGVVTIIGGFSWARQDIAQQLKDAADADFDPRQSTSTGSTSTGSSGSGQSTGSSGSSTGQSQSTGGGGKPDEVLKQQESDIVITDEEAAEDFNAAGGMPTPDGDVPKDNPPGIIHIFGPGPAAGGPADMPTPDDGGPVGPAARVWVVAPLYVASPAGAVAASRHQVAGFASFTTVR